jgi:hypothetical protein
VQELTWRMNQPREIRSAAAGARWRAVLSEAPTTCLPPLSFPGRRGLDGKAEGRRDLDGEGGAVPDLDREAEDRQLGEADDAAVGRGGATWTGRAARLGRGGGGAERRRRLRLGES